MRCELALRRRLIVALLGDGLYLVRSETTASKLQTLVLVAREAANGTLGAAKGMKDLLDEEGLPVAMAAMLRDSCRERPRPRVEDATPGAAPEATSMGELLEEMERDRRRRTEGVVPGGNLWEPAAPSPAAGGGEARAAKLGRLQRDVLRRLVNYATSHRGVCVAALRDGGGKTPSASLSRALRHLEERGLVTCIRGPGGRTLRVRPTPAGVSAVAR